MRLYPLSIFLVKDSEDINKNNVLETYNAYFTIQIDPRLGGEENPYVITETQNSGELTGWKLFRIPLSSFENINNANWQNVRFFRLRVEHKASSAEQILKIAKISLTKYSMTASKMV